MLPCPSHLLSLLAQCRSMKQLKQIHSQIFVSGLSHDNLMASAILSFSALSPSGNLLYSLRLLDHLPSPDTPVFNPLIRALSSSLSPNLSLHLLRRMLSLSLLPDHLTLPFLLRSSSRLSSLPLSLSLHSLALRLGLLSDLFVLNSLLRSYSSSSSSASARSLFDEIPRPNLVSWNSLLHACASCRDLPAARYAFVSMPRRDVVSWTAMISALVRCGEHREALATFDRMLSSSSTAPNHVTMVSVLRACAHLGALGRGRQMHRYIQASRLPLTLPLSTSLVDMYAKCGSIVDAWVAFRGVPPDRTDVLIWNAMIGGLATHGHSGESLALFQEMRSAGIDPDEITYLLLLSACAHGGLVEDARRLFDSLCATTSLTLSIEHYTCMIDVLGRAGYLDEAYDFLNSMPFEPTASMLGALLSGCSYYGRVDLGEVVGKKLIELEPDHDGRYVGLSNVYAVARRWDDAMAMRKAMERRGVKKMPGFSSLELDGILHRFIAHDRSHPQSTVIYLMLNFTTTQMKSAGDPQTGAACFD